MTTFSEDVLLQVTNVKHKKGEGTLYVMNERIAFILQNSEMVSVGHPYTEIKTQKISSEFKTKVQLQLVFHDGSTSTFQFVKSDRAEATRDRDKVKDLLFKLLPKFQKKVNKELEEKNRMLSENPTLLQLYRDLVITQVITPEEFWKQHAPQYALPPTNNNQHTGIPGNFLVNIKPQIDGCNSVKYNLNYETIQCIFKTYPAVRKKHIEYVPHKLSESEFWKKFFESHYFHKDRINMGSKDLFSECAKQDEQEFKKEMKKLNDHSLINLGQIDDIDQGEGYGVSGEDSGCANIAHENIIKRFNQHSIMVLKASNDSQTKSHEPLAKKANCIAVGKQQSNVASTKSDTLRNGGGQRLCEDDNNHNYYGSNYKKLLGGISDTDYEDLKSNSDSSSNLKLSNIERSANDLPKSSKSEQTNYKIAKATSIREHIVNEVQQWSKKSGILPIYPTAAVNALGELTPGGVLMKGPSNDTQSLAELVPQEMTEELQNLYMAAGELLRHFWACFPPTTPELEEKAIRTHNALRRFHSAKLKPYEDKILIERNHLNQISSHLNIMLNAAYDKFSSWHCRRKPHL